MPLRRAAIALALAALALAATLTAPFLNRGALYLAPVACVLASARIGGLSAGLLTTLSVGAGMAYYVLGPAGSFALASFDDVVSLTLFGIVGLLISAMVSRGRRTAATLEATLWNIDDGVIVTDRYGRVTFVNPVAARLTGWSPQEAKGRRVAEIFRTLHPATREPITDRIEGMLRDGVLREGTVLGPWRERLLVSTEGAERPIADSGASIIDERGDRIGAVLVFRDITERVRTIHALEEARESAERANRLKDEFVATISHELRTPLNAVLGWTKMLRTASLAPGAATRALEAVDRNADALAQLVSDLLDVSRIITGQLRLRPQDTDAAHLVADSLEALRPAFVAKRLTVTPEIERVPHIRVDPDRLRQIVWNLLSNAIKFTPPGGQIAVRVTQRRANVVVSVADTGQGIDPAQLPYVFNRFWQADTTLTRSVGGLGLGLAIVRHLVEAHAGTVSAASAGRDQGATFTVALPVPAILQDEQPEVAAAGPAAAPPDVQLLEGVRVLAVDDEPDSLDLVAAALGSRGAMVRTAQSADEALRIFSLHIPDVLVTDIAMPGKDGYALVREVRRRPGGATMPAVALTAYAGEPHRQAALDAGFTEHVGKPVNPDVLAALVGELAHRQPS